MANRLSYRVEATYDSGCMNLLTPVVTPSASGDKMPLTPTAQLDRINQQLHNAWQELQHWRTRLSTDYWQQLAERIEPGVLDGKMTPFVVSASIQGVTLIVLFMALLHLTQRSTALVSRAQQLAFQRIEHERLRALSVDTLRLLKPNIAWLSMLLSCLLLSHWLPNDWLIVSWIKPIGIAYSAYRGFHVLTEWLLIRSYIRTQHFVSNTIATDLDHRASAISVQLLLHAILLALAARSQHLWEPMLGISTLWLWCLTITTAKQNPFLMQATFSWLASPKNTAAAKKNGTAAKKKKQRFGLLRSLCLPLLYFLAHLLDMCKVVHTKLLHFDSYRSLQAKVLRAQLERKAESQAEDESDSKDEQSSSFDDYKSLILHDVSVDECVLYHDQTKHLMAPIKTWHEGKSEDNILLVVGSQGSGKSKLMRSLQTSCKIAQVRHHEINKKMPKRRRLFSAANIDVE